MSETIKNASAEIPSSSSAGYEVGYGKPPKATQFQPGVSGNPKGRPKQQKTLQELLLEELAKTVKFKMGDAIVTMDKKRALVRKAIDMALQGDMRALQLAWSRLPAAEESLEQQGGYEEPLSAEELAVFGLANANQSGGK
jgi:hypothetical protein